MVHRQVGPAISAPGARRLTALVFVLTACGSIHQQSSTPPSSTPARGTSSPASSDISTPRTAAMTTDSIAEHETVQSETTPAPLDPETSAPETAVGVRHLDHASLNRILPSVAEFGWLPAGTTAEDDSDLTSRLVLPNCAGAPTEVPSRRESATNRLYVSGRESLVSITLYDIETIDDARGFMTGLHAYTSCAVPSVEGVTFEVLEPKSPGPCDDQIAVRTYQPVSETIDTWCQVGNLVAWTRLYPSGTIAAAMDPTSPGPIPPTVEQSDHTLRTISAALNEVWGAAG
jgi:hypothetical protein